MDLRLDTYVDEYSCIGIKQRINEAAEEDILFNVSSLGGSFDLGLQLYYSLKAHKGNSKVIYSGRSASAATIFPMGANRREIYQNSFILVHKVLNPLMVLDFVNSDDLDQLIQKLTDSKEELDGYDKSVANIYYHAAKKKGKSEKDILTLMSKDRWLSANEALEWGFVDAIIAEDAEMQSDEELQALYNKFDLPSNLEEPKNQIQEQTNDKNDMDFITKAKEFFNKTLGLEENVAQNKATEFVATFNKDLKNEIETQAKEIAQDLQKEATESVTALQNEVKELETKLGKVPVFNSSEYVAKADFDILKASIEAFGVQKLENNSSNPNGNGTSPIANTNIQKKVASWAATEKK